MPCESSVGAQFTSQQISSGLVWVGVTGEIDIRNGDALRSFACRQFESSQRLVLDLADVEFFGSTGLAVFEGLDDCAKQHGGRWALVCGRPVQRLLRVADTGIPIQVHTSLESAMRALRLVA
ncbi:STAS domain-containing protein [Rhodococcus chondri]|uniref:STAS domain-containing protein n=1 Tax=Rhodococcus chondri TaxID=3065941 RepID=A0ABU7JSQ6_9NOCA|nr:STAS domain-containing protein [Rhodococcus sp. CC-R104]MEE2033065.1 STAS domain-containing protein [Rhodococcus sp. CC-R104]